eukprot:IDg4337t1
MNQEWREFDNSEIRTTYLVKEASTARPLSFMADIGAPRSVIGKRELRRSLSPLEEKDNSLRPSRNRFRFVDGSFSYLGRIRLHLDTPVCIPKIQADLDVIEADISALLELD